MNRIIEIDNRVSNSMLLFCLEISRNNFSNGIFDET